MRKLAVLAFALLLAVLQFVYGMNEFWDDTFIGLVYSQNIARGVGPVYVPLAEVEITPYARVEGYSNPLWIFLTAGMYLLPGSVFFWLKLASFLSAVLLAFACSGLLQELVDEEQTIPRWAFLPPMALILLYHSVFAYLKSGMETVSFTALVVFATWHTSRTIARDRKRGLIANSLLWLGVCLTRPEGILFAAAVAAFLLLFIWRRELKRFALWSIPLALGVSAFYLWRHYYYGEWLPNTFYAKVAIKGGNASGWLEIFGEGITYTASFFLRDVPLVTLVFVIVGMAVWARHVRVTRLLLILTIIAANLLFVIVVGGDFWALSRFLQVSWSMLAVLACLPIAMLAGQRPYPEWAVRRRLQFGSGWAVPVALVLALHQPMVHIFQFPHIFGKLPLLSTQRLYETLTSHPFQPAFFLGKWLRENLPPDAVVGIDQAGQLAYYSELRNIDLLGLSDHHLARNRLSYEYLAARNMTHLVPIVVPVKGRPDILYPHLLDDPGFRRDFVLTGRFEGTDQHGEVEVFLLFERKDQLVSTQTGRAVAIEAGATIQDLLPTLPVTLLSPDLVKDLAP